MMTVQDFGLTEGDLGIAIPTSIPFENLIKKDFLNGRTLNVNVGTIVRNWLTSIDFRGQMLPKTVGDFILAELEVIKAVCRDKNVRVKFYFSDVEPLYRRMVLSHYLRKRKDVDMAMQPVVTYVMRTYNKHLTAQEKRIKHSGIRFKSVLRSTVVMSHSNLDYLDLGTGLLESHTGKFKEHRLLYDKYPSGAGVDPSVLERIPYTEDLLLLMGTKSLFKIKKVSMRNAILRIAEQYDWNPTMSKLKLQAGLSDPEVRTYLESLPKLNA